MHGTILYITPTKHMDHKPFSVSSSPEGCIKPLTELLHTAGPGTFPYKSNTLSATLRTQWPLKGRIAHILHWAISWLLCQKLKAPLPTVRHLLESAGKGIIIAVGLKLRFAIWGEIITGPAPE